MLNRYHRYETRPQWLAAAVLAAVISLTGGWLPGCQGSDPSASINRREKSSTAIPPATAPVTNPAALGKNGVTITLDGRGPRVKVTLMEHTRPQPVHRSWSLAGGADSVALGPLIRGLAKIPRTDRINVQLRGRLSVPFYQGLLTALAQDGRNHVGHAGARAFRGTMTCPATPHPNHSPTPPAHVISLKANGLYLNAKRLYAFREGRTPGSLKRDGDDGFLVDPLYRAFTDQPRRHVSVVAAPGLTFPSRLLLEIHYTAETAFHAKATAGAQSRRVTFSVACGQ